MSVDLTSRPRTSPGPSSGNEAEASAEVIVPKSAAQIP